LSKVACFNVYTPPEYGAPVGVKPFEFCRELLLPKTSVPAAIMRRWLRDSAFSHFDKIPACDGRTDNLW